jgi:pimeloyl-ACP methyl ester carboxylesterase
LIAGCSSSESATINVERVDTPPTGAAPTTAGGSSPTTPTLDPVPAPTEPAITDTVPERLPAADIGWEDCGDRLECGTLTVPVSYSDPAAGVMELYLVRHLADSDKRIGSLLVNPGGPGVAGTLLSFNAEFIYSERLLDHFDIVGFDPRGTGDSNPVDCIDNLDEVFAVDPSPDNADELTAIRESAALLRDGCAQRMNPDLLANISTADVARDMDQIRQALGEATISYFGFSYGSELGATYATLFPETMRAVVLDGAVNPNEPSATTSMAQAVSIDRTVIEMMNACTEDRDCPFGDGGDALAAYDKLMERIDSQPVPSQDGRPDINQGIGYWATISALYSKDSWAQLWQALADLEDGDGSGMLELYDNYMGRTGDGWDNSFEALLAIRCLEDPGPTTSAQLESLRAELTRISQRMGPIGIDQTFCTGWPASSPKIQVSGIGAGTILVVGATGDPVTPLATTRELAEELESARLLIRDGEGHTSYSDGSDCIDDAVDDYLIDLTLPENETVCPG